VVGEIKVLVLDQREVVSLGLERILGSFDDGAEHARRNGRGPGPPAAEPDGVRRVVLITGGGRDGAESTPSAKADGYLVLRDVTAESLRATLLGVLTDQTRLPDDVTMYLLDVARGHSPGPGADMPRLSRREQEVLELLVAGHSNQEIADELGISIHGAKRHVSSLLAKFDSPSRSHLVSRVLRARAALEA
jgi:DNA-binding NarL/FixJ family response regulator